MMEGKTATSCPNHLPKFQGMAKNNLKQVFRRTLLQTQVIFDRGSNAVVLQTILFFGSCVALLYHFGVMQFCLVKLAWVMQATMDTSSTESLNAVASTLLGQSESPLLIRPYLSKMTESELFAVMCAGFASSAGSLFAAYACPAYVVAASIMSAPASLACSKLFFPETEQSKTKSVEELKLLDEKYRNALEAICSGAANVVDIIFHIAASLLVFISFLTFANSTISWLGDMVGVAGFTFERIFSYIFYPVAYIMDVSDSTDQKEYTRETMIFAELMGTKIVLNEFLAFKKMGQYVKDGLLKVSSFLLCKLIYKWNRGKTLQKIAPHRFLGSTTLKNDSPIEPELKGRIAIASSAFGNLANISSEKEVTLSTNIPASVRSLLLYVMETVFLTMEQE
ncbi:unnamed protein product [Soboliphyme baturini]|uniref:Nucleos_tra2_C domain-containing protein n=1 Tax=Soboliphyme baturini TaxID=241478 RepID=A0A183J7W9_9BILA|nr:unnamed protein product [Soboliphyme baturini]